MIRRSPLCLLFTLLACLAPTGWAGPLKQASVNLIINDVKLVDPKAGARPAKVKDTVQGDLGVRTGAASRSELLFQDQTLTRLGAETFFSFTAGTRDLKLERGTMLLQVPKGLGGTKIKTAAVTAAITGTTILMETFPGKHTKVVVLEGSLRLERNGRFGESVVLTAGKMVLLRNHARSLPEPVDVDIRKMIKTSSLIDSAAFRGKAKVVVQPLPSMGLIAQEIARQDELKGSTGLVETNLVIVGSGDRVLVADETQLAALDTRKTTDSVPTIEDAAPKTTIREPNTNGNKTPASDTTKVRLNDPLPDGSGNDSGGSSSGSGSTDSGSGGTDSGSSGTGSGAGTVTPPAPLGQLIDATTATVGAILNLAGLNGLVGVLPTAGKEIEIRGPVLEISPLGINGIQLSGGNSLLGLIAQEGGDGGILHAGTVAYPIPGHINVEAPIYASTGQNGLLTSFGGKGGSVELVANGQITVASTIQVSDSASGKASKQGGHIALRSNATGTAIKVDNSSQILSLLANAAPGPGGTIRFAAPNGSIEVKNSNVRADRGTIEIAAGGASGQVLLQNATLRGDVIKASSYGTDGTLLVGGTTIDADTAIKLYAAGTNGEVRFIDNTTLKGASLKTIAAQTVTIDNGKRVAIQGGAATVFTNTPNYTGSGGNGSTSGQFTGNGATTQPFGNRPNF
jgi:hypothetical protein